jgi:hypothetical protein
LRLGVTSGGPVHFVKKVIEVFGLPRFFDIGMDGVNGFAVHARTGAFGVVITGAFGKPTAYGIHTLWSVFVNLKRGVSIKRIYIA